MKELSTMYNLYIYIYIYILIILLYVKFTLADFQHPYYHKYHIDSMA